MNKKLLLASLGVTVIGFVSYYLSFGWFDSEDLGGLTNFSVLIIPLTTIVIAVILAALGFFWSSIKNDKGGVPTSPKSLAIAAILFLAIIIYFFIRL